MLQVASGEYISSMAKSEIKSELQFRKYISTNCGSKVEAQILQFMLQLLPGSKSISTSSRSNGQEPDTGNFKGQQRDFFAHCFCQVTFLLKLQLAFLFLFVFVFGVERGCCKNNHHAKSNDPTLCQVPHPLPLLGTTLSRSAVRSVRFASFYRKILRLESLLLSSSSLPPHRSHTYLNFALRRFAVFRVRAFHTKKMQDSCKIYLQR